MTGNKLPFNFTSSNSLLLNHFPTTEINSDVGLFSIYLWQNKRIIFQYIEQLISKPHIMVAKQQTTNNFNFQIAKNIARLLFILQTYGQ